LLFAFHFLVDNPASRCHPLHIAGSNCPSISHAVPVLDSSSQDVRDRFNSAVRMPGEAGQVVVGNIIAEIVEQKKWIEVRCVSKPEGTTQMHARALHGRL
jgi:hypothetical protein